MLKIYIDNNLIDITDDTTVAVSASAGDISDIGLVKEQVKSIKIPATPVNKAIMGFPEQVLSPGMFNQSSHTIKVECDGEVIIEGSPYLESSETNENGDEWYNIDIVMPAPLWIKSASGKLLRETNIEFEGIITGELIRNSWTWDCPVRFLPVQRDRYDPAEVEGEIAPTRILTTEDYHPFINIKALTEAIAEESGYSIISGFMETEFFRSLYMSGYYPSQDIEIIKSRMNFFAGKLSDSSATADTWGVVYSEPEIDDHTVGNIVDTGNLYAYDSFNYGKAFRFVNGKAAFVPSEDVVVGFEYRLIYTCDYEPDSETSMKGFTEIYLDDQVVRYVNEKNTLDNKKGSVCSAGDYIVMVFDYSSSIGYKLIVDQGNGVSYTINLSGKKNEVNLNSAGTPKLYVRNGSSDILKTSNWAIYKKYDYRVATENVKTDVTLRSAPALRKKNTPVYFRNVFFAGANAGARLTLCADTSVRPIFYSNPMDGSQVTTNEIFAHEQKQIELFKALQHLFNLQIYTDTLSKRIYIEPFDDIFKDTNIVDWTDKLDKSMPVTIEEQGRGNSAFIALSYNNGDGSVKRWNEANKKRYARWECGIKSLFAKDKEENRVNPLFSPSVNEDEVFPSAWSASWLKAGDRSSSGNNYDDGNLNFTPKIVRFLGMKNLSSGETWGYPSYGNSYPRVTFHDSEDGHTLCFDDFEGKTGLHSFYDGYFDSINNKKKITAYLNLSVVDMEHILYPGNIGKDMRSVFRLCIYGETIDCRLEEIIDYTAGKEGPTKCVFVKL